MHGGFVMAGFTFLLNVLLISRLAFLFRDKPRSKLGVAVMLAIQTAGLLCFEVGPAWWVFLFLLAASTLLFRALERNGATNTRPRLLSLMVGVALVSIFCSPSIGMKFDDRVGALFMALGRFTLAVPVLAHLCTEANGRIVLGVLIVMNEANLLLRLLLSIMNVGPATNGEKKNLSDAAVRSEYSAGRVIGILERVLIYTAVLGNQIAAIGLVIAAKGFARFKEMDDRQFAEYVLIGTLLSALLAIGIGLAVKAMV
jgi:hypothetical protein